MVTSMKITSRPQLCFGSGPRNAAKLDKAMPWLTLGPAVMANDSPGWHSQSVEAATLRRHTWKADEYSMEILPSDFKIKAFK